MLAMDEEDQERLREGRLEFLRKRYGHSWTAEHARPSDQLIEYLSGNTNEYDEDDPIVAKCLACDSRPFFLGMEPDPCLGELPGVKSACCGHGGETGYLFFENGVHFPKWPTIASG